MIDRIKSRDNILAPAFIFVDPYGFKVPGEILRELMQFPRVELFLNVMWRELDMEICQAQKYKEPTIAKTLDFVFNSQAWRNIEAETSDERAELAIDQFQSLCDARWATSIRMLAGSRRTRYILVHLTNHEAGRDLMKECIWRVCPDGGFYARRSDNPDQQLLITPKPDLTPLEQWIRQVLASEPKRWGELTDAIRERLWLPKHLNGIIRQLRREGDIVASDYIDRFVPTNDPLLSLSENEAD
jgi:hypothetical protein